MVKVRPGVASVILVNFRGAADTIEAISRLREVDWPADRLEIIVVENGSGDDSEQRIRAAHADVQLIVSRENLGFAGGSNLGAARSSGEYLAFLNNDAKPDAAWISAAVEAFESSERVGAVASRVLDWEGVNVDYIGSAMTWYGQGYKPFTSEQVPPNPEVPSDVLFGTGSAMFVRRSVFEQLGGFDERYFMFFEDVDLGWRLNLRGWRFAYVPESLAFHKHHASMSSFGAHKESYLLERNALYTLYKNAGDETLRSALPAAMALSVRRGVTRAGLDSGEFDLRRGADDGAQQTVDRQGLVPLYAIDSFVDAIPGLTADRTRIQAERTVPESAIWRLFGLADAPVLQDAPYLEGYEKLVAAFDVATAPEPLRVLVITGDPVGVKLAGPAIRAWNMAAALGTAHEVRLVTLAGHDGVEAPFDIVHVTAGDDHEMSRHEQWADLIVFQGVAMAVFDSLKRSTKVIVADIYDPMHLEHLEQGRTHGFVDWSRGVSDATDILNEQLERGDFFLAASERQRSFYLGQLAGLGRINPATYDGDPDLRGLIDVVPFGLPVDPPVHERDVLRGVVPGIDADDRILLWSGGLYDWFDPETLIRAVALLAERRPSVRLYFQGTKHPHPNVPEMAVVSRSRHLADELGVAGRQVFFNDSWVDYADRQNYLLEADAGVSTHFSHIETTFSFRTRILDYLWAGLPMVVTDGDHFADLIRSEGLGVVVPPDDAEQLADALEKVLFDEVFARDARERIAEVRERYRWDRVLEPLVRFAADPHRARDAAGGTGVSSRRATRVRRSGVRHNLRLVGHYFRAGGFGLVARKVRQRLARNR